MDANEIRQLIKASMPSEMYQRSGAVLLGGSDTLRRGAVYVMGLNPGGNPDEIKGCILESVEDRDSFSCYTHDCWQPKCPPGCEHVTGEELPPHFLVRHQTRMISLAQMLNSSPSALFSANAIFARSTSLSALFAETEHTLKEWWEACWPIHQRFLAVVRPRLIVSLGYGTSSSAFGLLHRQAGTPSWSPLGDPGRRGGWTFDAEFDLGGDTLRTQVIGVPHPSYMAPGPLLEEELRRIAALAVP